MCWVRGCWERPWVVLSMLVPLVLGCAFYAAQEARIDSDFSKLLRPSETLRWYQHDQAFKAAFPQFQQNAVVVLEGGDFEQVRAATRDLRDRLLAREQLGRVQALGVHPFFEARSWWYLPPDELDRWLGGVQRNYGPLLRLGESPTLTELALTVADQAFATPGVTLPTVLSGLLDGWQEPELSLQAYPALVPVGRHRELIVVQGVRRFEDALPHAELIGLLRAELATLPTGVTARLTGEAALATEEIGAALDGIEIAGIVSLLLLAIVLWYGLRSVTVVVGVFAVLLFGVPLTLALSVFLVGSFNTLALLFVIMFLVLVSILRCTFRSRRQRSSVGTSIRFRGYEEPVLR